MTIRGNDEETGPRDVYNVSWLQYVFFFHSIFLLLIFFGSHNMFRPRCNGTTNCHHHQLCDEDGASRRVCVSSPNDTLRIVWALGMPVLPFFFICLTKFLFVLGTSTYDKWVLRMTTKMGTTNDREQGLDASFGPRFVVFIFIFYI